MCLGQIIWVKYRFRSWILTSFINNYLLITANQARNMSSLSVIIIQRACMLRYLMECVLHSRT